MIYKSCPFIVETSLNCFSHSKMMTAVTSHMFLPELGPVSRKSRKLFGPEKPFVKLRSAYSVKLVFSYVVKGIKIKITAKFRASRRLRFEDAKRILSPERRRKVSGLSRNRPLISEMPPGSAKDIPYGQTDRSASLRLYILHFSFYFMFWARVVGSVASKRVLWNTTVIFTTNK